MARLGLTRVSHEEGESERQQEIVVIFTFSCYMAIGYPQECEQGTKERRLTLFSNLSMPGIPTKYKAAELEGVDCIGISPNWSIFRSITHTTIYSEFGFIRLSIKRLTYLAFIRVRM